MLKHTKNCLLSNILLIALTITLSIVFLSLFNTSKLPQASVRVSDKFMHALAYLVLFWAWMAVFRKSKTIKTGFILFLVLLFFGIVLEILQGNMTTYRTADWKDVIANATGLILGLISFRSLYTFLKYRVKDGA